MGIPNILSMFDHMANVRFFLYLSGTKKVKITWLITESNPADINRFRGPLSLNIMLMLLIVGVY